MFVDWAGPHLCYRVTVYLHRGKQGDGVGVGYSGKGTGWRKKERETQEAKYLESWPSTTSAWAGWSRLDIPVDR